jgi:twitching motility two-component system response regulator PilG
MKFLGACWIGMQGKLSEIDIRSILQLIELGQRTGELFVEAHGSSSAGVIGDSGSGSASFNRKALAQPSQSWFVFFLNGQIIYAGSTTSNLSRLRDHLRRYRVHKALDQTNASTIATLNAPEYGYLWALLENCVLTPAQGRDVIQSMVYETLFDLLSLHQGSFVFELGSALSPQLITLEIAPLMARTMKQVQEWKQFYPHIQSPDQCPAIADANHLRETVAEATFKILERWADGKTSLRQMARYLNRDILTIARAVYPHIRDGSVQLLNPPADGEAIAHKREMQINQDRVPRIVCIDDGLTVRQAVEDILNRHGYEVTAISNPLKALSLVFQLKPDLILCDIAMPELDGYELCTMLRRSTAFRGTPIVMLTGKDGFIDRVKARMVGATDYLTKPFGEGELLMLVERYVGIGDLNRPKPEKLLAEALEDELEIGR